MPVIEGVERDSVLIDDELSDHVFCEEEVFRLCGVDDRFGFVKVIHGIFRRLSRGGSCIFRGVPRQYRSRIYRQECRRQRLHLE